MRLLFFLLFFLNGLHVLSQTTVYRKIAQRHDDYVNSAWQGVDSILFSYNNDAILTQQVALKGSGVNWNNFSRNTFLISSTGKTTEHLRENWNSGNWVNSTRYNYTYDATDNLTLTLYDTWNGSAWQSAGKIENTGYNTFGGWAEQTTSVYSGGNWQYLSRFIQGYVAGTGKVETRTRENWNTTNAVWDKYDRFFYTYFQDSIGSIIRSVPDSNNNWVSSDKYVYNYTGSPLKLQSYYAQYWLADSNKFVDTTRLLNTFNANQNLEMSITEKRIGYNSWTTLTRTFYYYNGGNQLIEKTFEEYSNAWDNKDRFLYTYTGNLLSEEIYYEGFNTTWNLHHKTIFNYDGNENLVFKQRDDFAGSNYIPYSRDFYYYNTFVVGVNDWSLSNSFFSVYPNPANGQIAISIKSKVGSWYTISIYDEMGRLRLIRQEASQGENFNTEINMSTFSSGTYFVKLSDDKNKSSVVKVQLK